MSLTVPQSPAKMVVNTFLYFSSHLLVKFEKFHKGWITYSTEHHPHTGRVFKIVTNYTDTHFTAKELQPISYFEELLRADEGRYAWGEVWKDGVMLYTTQDA
jgi:hypothetical protein